MSCHAAAACKLVFRRRRHLKFTGHRRQRRILFQQHCRQLFVDDFPERHFVRIFGQKLIHILPEWNKVGVLIVGDARIVLVTHPDVERVDLPLMLHFVIIHQKVKAFAEHRRRWFRPGFLRCFPSGLS